jgi:hypothetical protein
MKCQRCARGEEAKYRVYTDIIDMKVCAACAEEARRLGIDVEVLEDGEKKDDKSKLSRKFRIAGQQVSRYKSAVSSS